MKIQLVWFWIAFLVVALLGCSDEGNFEYPIVHTGMVTLDNSDVTFTGKITNTGDIEIKEYGFIYAIATSYTYNTSFADKISKDQIFKSTIDDYTIGTRHYVKAFVIVPNDTIYGKPQYFNQHGRMN